MVNISRDSQGKTRIVKGDKTGLGGQYAPDPQKLAAAKTRLNHVSEYNIEKLDQLNQKDLKAKLMKQNFITLAETIYEAEKSSNTNISGTAMQVAEKKGIWEETLEEVTRLRRSNKK